MYNINNQKIKVSAPLARRPKSGDAVASTEASRANSILRSKNENIIKSYIIYVFFRWSINKGKVDKTLDNLKKFEKINKAKIPEDLLHALVVSNRDLILGLIMNS